MARTPKRRRSSLKVENVPVTTCRTSKVKVNRTLAPASYSSIAPVQLNLLEQCYAQVVTLRKHILSRLPSSSRLRRKKISTLGQSADAGEVEARVSSLLDTTLVCSTKREEQQHEDSDTRWKQWLSFSQKGDESYVTLAGGPEASMYSQSEVMTCPLFFDFLRTRLCGGALF